MLKTLSIIFFMELLNIAAHSAFRPLTKIPSILDLASFSVSMGLLFLAAKQVLTAYPRNMMLALLSGIIFLTASNLLISPTLAFINFWGSESVEFQDLLIGYIVSLPLALVVAWLGFFSDRKK